MSLPVACPHCNYEYEAAAELEELSVRCPKCRERSNVETAEAHPPNRRRLSPWLLTNSLSFFLVIAVIVVLIPRKDWMGTPAPWPPLIGPLRH
jgi:hypothetical protein